MAFSTFFSKRVISKEGVRVEEIKIWAIEDTSEVVPLEPKGQVDAILEVTCLRSG